MHKGLRPDEIMHRIKANFVMGGHKAYGFAKVANRARITMVSSMNAADSKCIFADKADSIQEAFDAALREAPNARVAILAQGGLTLPVQS